MAQTWQDFGVYEGNHATINVSLFDDSGEPLDIAGASITWVYGKAGSAPIVSKSSAAPSEIEVISAPEGRVAVYLLPTDTTLAAGNNAKSTFRHELTLTDAAGKVETLLSGNITIIRTVTPEI